MKETRQEIVVEGLRTAYFEAGSGPTVVLLHSGEHGGCAEITWEYNFDVLAEEFHVLAPDWLGCGGSEKIYDFLLGTRRRTIHMQRFLLALGVERADFIGASMGGTLAVRELATDPAFFPARSLTLIGAGGLAPDNEHRRALLDYDCTIDGMRRVVTALFHDPSWANDEAYVKRRFDESVRPGVWECTAAARFKNPLIPPRSNYGQPDTTPYENIECPVLVIGGACDKLKEPGYGDKLAGRFADAEVHVIADSGHMPNIEKADEVNPILLRFLRAMNEGG